jgi:hypothetical protein
MTRYVCGGTRCKLLTFITRSSSRSVNLARSVSSAFSSEALVKSPDWRWAMTGRAVETKRRETPKKSDMYHGILVEAMAGLR